MRRIGIFGGTFDPIHYGHLRLAEEAREFAELDQVLFIPAMRSPFRLNEPLTDAHHRIAIIQRAIANHPNFALSEIEIQRGGISYTIETLESLRAHHRGVQWFLIMGLDSLTGFAHWHEAERLAQLVDLLVGIRPPYVYDEVLRDLPDWLQGRVQVMPMTPMGISATELREKVRQGHSIRYLTPDDVIEYIQENQLYLEPR